MQRDSYPALIQSLKSTHNGKQTISDHQGTAEIRGISSDCHRRFYGHRASRLVQNTIRSKSQSESSCCKAWFRSNHSSIAVSVPPVEITWDEQFTESITPFVRTLIENAQDGIVRSLYESSQGAVSSVSDSDLSIAACINYLQADATGGRLTKEAITSWFNSNLRDNLTVMIADKLGTQDVDALEVKQKLNAFAGVFGSLSGGATILQPGQIKACKTALSLCTDLGDVGEKLSARLIAMSEPKKQIAELLDLG